MTCKCGSKRIASIGAKCSDLCYTQLPDRPDIDGYVPSNIGIGGGDYVEFDYCLDCGQIQSNEFPITQAKIDEYYEDQEIDITPKEYDDDGFEILA